MSKIKNVVNRFKTISSSSGTLEASKAITKELVRKYLMGVVDSKEIVVREEIKLIPENYIPVESILKSFKSGAKRINTIEVKGKKRVNILIPMLDESSTFGGIATAIIFATLYANSMKCNLRIITTDSHCKPNFYNVLCELFKIKPSKVEFLDVHRRHHDEQIDPMEVSTEDIFIATIWWSSYLARQVKLNKKFIYLIQEYESVFYNKCDYQIQVERSYKSFDDFIPLLNTKNLLDFYTNSGYPHIAKNGICFEPCFPNFLYSPGRNQFVNKNEYNLFFYCRPNTPRNLYYTGLELINNAFNTEVLDPKKWKVHFAGEKIDPIIFSCGLVPIIHGKLSWTKYTELLNKIDLGISLMSAPHPSYPPLDMLASGACVFSNISEGKVNLPYSRNLFLANLEDESYMLKLKEAIKTAQNPELRRQNFESQILGSDWDKTFINVIDTLNKQL